MVPSLHFTRPNPLIPFEALRLEVSRETRAWPVPDGPAVAGVSAFGWGGTNAHVVLQEAPPSRLAWVGLAASGAEA
ncbi:ketoacyl-synthetase C-terminal extension domain-containing protein [Corallococcus sp. 4LFB]|uniref:ketoacyl-synthetase C-terminal extension domain-containing protein n=1 Tax=Corallococcus sp. 4LFB TaxID=3383249 RepID=UPI00397628F9